MCSAQPSVSGYAALRAALPRLAPRGARRDAVLRGPVQVRGPGALGTGHLLAPANPSLSCWLVGGAVLTWKCLEIM